MVTLGRLCVRAGGSGGGTRAPAPSDEGSCCPGRWGGPRREPTSQAGLTPLQAHSLVGSTRGTGWAQTAAAGCPSTRQHRGPRSSRHALGLLGGAGPGEGGTGPGLSAGFASAACAAGGLSTPRGRILRCLCGRVRVPTPEGSAWPPTNALVSYCCGAPAAAESSGRVRVPWFWTLATQAGSGLGTEMGRRQGRFPLGAPGGVGPSPRLASRGLRALAHCPVSIFKPGTSSSVRGASPALLQVHVLHTV